VKAGGYEFQSRQGYIVKHGLQKSNTGDGAQLWSALPIMPKAVSLFTNTMRKRSSILMFPIVTVALLIETFVSVWFYFLYFGAFVRCYKYFLNKRE
jgi:hypothetical protein